MNKVRLGDTCEILNGYAFKSENYVTEGIRVIRIANVQKGYIEDKEPQYYPIDFEEDITKYFLYENDLLISLTGNVGRVALLPKEMLPAALNQRVACLRMNAKSDISKDYLFHYLNSDKFENDCITSSKGVAQKNMSTEWLKNYEIPVFSQVKQRHISILLSLIDSLIEKEKLQLQKSDELIKSQFVEMFGDPVINPYNWQSLKIKKAVEVEPQNGLYKPQSDYVADKSGVPILRIDGFYNGKVVDFQKLKRLMCTKEEFDKYRLVENDIVINRVNSLEYLGKCACISGLIEGTVFESNMMRMHFYDERFNPIYITFLLCSKFTYNQIIRHAKKAVNQASINQKDVLDLNIYEPPIDLQNQFADFVSKVEQQKATIQKSINKLETLKESLMQEYFGA